MECYCGCGRRVSRQLTDTNLRISAVALELLAWDKRRSTAPMEPGDFVETERLIDRGASSHRRLLATLHGEFDDVSLEPSAEWLAESKASWRDREEMTERGGFLRGPKLKLTKEDLARIDRVHPERSFSGSSAVPVEVAGARHDGGDSIGQLERLRSLRAEGILTEDEFRAAEARLHDQI
ncbi:MAG TPA: SHOCT domain-containing protein [Solirubrobacterales bacterium]